MAVEVLREIEEQLASLPANHPHRKFLEAQRVVFEGFIGAGSFSSEAVLDLITATTEYKKDPYNPERLTSFMRSFWQEADRKISTPFKVDAFPLISKELKERYEKGEMPVFIPQDVSLGDLGRMFPKMESYSVEEGAPLVNGIENSGWLWVEASIDAPNRNTTEDDLQRLAKSKRKIGQSLRTYIVGSLISKLLHGKYFDQGATRSRLPGSRYEDHVISVFFHSGGKLRVDWNLGPRLANGHLGGRFEEVIKT